MMNRPLRTILSYASVIGMGKDDIPVDQRKRIARKVQNPEFWVEQPHSIKGPE